MADLKAKVTLKGDSKQLVGELTKVEKGFAKLGGTLERHSAEFLRAGAAIGGALVGLTAQGIAYGTTIDRISKMTGESADAISAMGYSVELLHGDTEMLEKGLKQLAQRMSYARDGLETYTREFERAGIEYKNADGMLRSVTDVYLDLADAVSQNEDGTEALANVMQLLGGRQSQLTPHLKQGSKAIREQMERAKDLGLVLDNETAEALEKTGTAIKDVKLALRGVSADVAGVFSESIINATAKITDMMAAFNNLPEPIKRATVETTGFTAGALVLGGVIGKLKKIGIASWIKTVGAGFGALAGPVMDGAVIAVGSLGGALAAFLSLAIPQKLGEMEDIDWGTPAFEEWARALNEMGPPAVSALDALANASKEFWSVVGAPGPKPDPDDLNPFAGVDPVAYWDTFIKPLEDIGGGIRGGGVVAPIASEFRDNLLPAIDLGINKVQEFGYFMAQTFADNAPQAIDGLLGTVDNAMAKLVEIEGKFAKTMLKATKNYLISFLDMVVKARIKELMLAQITEEGKISMSALFNPANLLKLAGLSAVYAGASAALHGAANASFREGGVVTQSGQYTGLFHAGDAIVGPDAMKALLSGKGGGGTNIEAHVHIHGAVAATSDQLHGTMMDFADRLALQMGRA